MPGQQDHEILARENLKALQFIRTRVDDFPQWATIIAFYSALQVVEALFANEGVHSDQHTDRNHRLKSEKRYQHIWKHYRDLWNDSLIARYMEDAARSRHGPLFAVYLTDARVEQTHVRHNLAQVIKSARRLMKNEEFLKGCDP
jgi:RNase P protein component